jgi:hypothetical protein
MTWVQRHPVSCAALLLLLLALGVATWRYTRFRVPLRPGEQAEVWFVEARIDFEAEGVPVTVSLDLPDAPPGFRIAMEQSASPGYGFAVVEEQGERRGEWTIRTARGPQTLYYKVQIIPETQGREAAVAPPAVAAPVYRDEAEATAAAQLLAAAQATSSGPASLARELLRLLAAAEPGQNAALLLTSRSPAAGLDLLLRQAGVPTRLSLGLNLEDGRRRQELIPIIEVFTGQRWQVFDLAGGRQGLPEHLLLWHRGSRSLLDVTGGRDSRVGFSMLRQAVPALALARQQMGVAGLAQFDIHHLPVEEQGMLKLLLLLPVGVLVVVFMRLLVGLRTAGTFMPVLLAVAFLQSALLPGLASFVAIVALGLVLRGCLERFNLLLVARIAALVIAVIFLICLLSVVGYRLGLNTGMTLTFFPMVIIAWTIERMSVLWEEEGAREVLSQGGGSLLVALIAYGLMSCALVRHLSFNYPELNLVPLALILLLGQYTGYRLLELRRFRFFVERPL